MTYIDIDTGSAFCLFVKIVYIRKGYVLALSLNMYVLTLVPFA